jgi:hypothetical protein
MTPEKSAQILSALLLSLESFRDQAEVVANVHPGCGDCAHLANALQQACVSLKHMIETD